MIPMQTPVVVTAGPYKGTEGVIIGKFNRGNLYNVRTLSLVFWGKPYPKPHGTELSAHPSQIEVTAP